MIRSAQDVIKVVKERGMSIRINPGPPMMPVLLKPGTVPASEATEALMNALKIWRLEIIEEINKQA